MGKSIFGWSYPPGCSGPPDDDYAPSELVENVLGLLEDAEVDPAVSDKVVALIEDWENRPPEALEPEVLPPEGEGGL